MSTFVATRIKACVVHRLQYNAESGNCPLCDEEREVHRLAPGRVSWKGKPRFPCPFCGARSIYAVCCSKFGCRKRAGLLKPRYLHYRCVHCGSRTKYAACCTNLSCRRKAGRVGMYRRMH